MRQLRYASIILLFTILPWTMAQDDLPQGVWHGSIKLAGKDESPARIHVTKEDDAEAKSKTSITMYVEETPLEFIDLEIRKDSLRFNLDTGTLSKCVMQKQASGAYQGFCDVSDAEDKNARIELTMRPPAQEQGTSAPEKTESQ